MEKKYYGISMGDLLAGKTVAHLPQLTRATPWLHTHYRVGKSAKITAGSYKVQGVQGKNLSFVMSISVK